MYEKTSFRVLVFVHIIFMVQFISTQVPGFGKCPKVKVIEDFKVHNYLGDWYQIKSYPLLFTVGAKCITASYGLLSNGTISVTNKWNKKEHVESEMGLARVVHSHYGIFGVAFPSNIACKY